jgi:predicted small lipoprotein YifL
MSSRLLPLAIAVFSLAACGVKANLERPMAGAMPAETQSLQNPRKDPSLPPRPLGEPGGTIPPYTTGP